MVNSKVTAKPELKEIDNNNITLPNYSSEMGQKELVEKRYSHSVTNQIILPLVGEKTEGVWVPQTPEFGIGVLTKDINRGSISLNGKEFKGWKSTLDNVISKAAKKAELCQGITEEKAWRLVITDVVEEFSVTDNKGETVSFLEADREDIIKKAVDAAMLAPAETRHAAVSTILVESFTRGLIQQTTGAPADALDSLAVHYHQNSLMGHPYYIVDRRVLNKSTGSQYTLCSVDPKKSHCDIDFVNGKGSKSSSYFDIRPHTFYAYGLNQDTRLSIQDPIVSQLKLIPSENLSGSRVVLDKSFCSNPNGVAANIYRGTFDEYLAGDDATILAPELKQKIENEKKQRDFDKAKQLYQNILSSFNEVATSELNRITDENHKTKYTSLIEDRITAHKAVLTEMDTMLTEELSDDELAEMLPVFTNTLHMETGMLLAAIENIDDDISKTLLNSKDHAMLEKALTDAPNTLMRLASIPKANKVLGAVLATAGFAIGLAAAASLVGAAIVFTFGLAAIPILAIAAASVVAAAGATGMGVKSHDLLTTPTEDEAVSAKIRKQVLSAQKGIEKETQKLKNLAEKTKEKSNIPVDASNEEKSVQELPNNSKATWVETKGLPIASNSDYAINSQGYPMLPVDAKRGDNATETLTGDLQRASLTVNGKTPRTLEALTTELKEMGASEAEINIFFEHYTQKALGHANAYLVTTLGVRGIVPKKSNSDYHTTLTFCEKTRAFILTTTTVFENAMLTSRNSANFVLPDSGGAITEEVRLQTKDIPAPDANVELTKISPFSITCVRGTGFIFNAYRHGAKTAENNRDAKKLQMPKEFAQETVKRQKYYRIVSLLKGLNADLLSNSALPEEQKAKLLALKENLQPVDIEKASIQELAIFVWNANIIVGNINAENQTPGQSYYLILLLGQYQNSENSGLDYLCQFYEVVADYLPMKDGLLKEKITQIAKDKSQDNRAYTDGILAALRSNLPLSIKDYKAAFVPKNKAPAIPSTNTSSDETATNTQTTEKNSPEAFLRETLDSSEGSPPPLPTLSNNPFIILPDNKTGEGREQGQKTENSKRTWLEIERTSNPLGTYNTEPELR